MFWRLFKRKKKIADVVISQGEKGRWRWTAYEAINTNNCIAVAPPYGYVTAEAARRAAIAILGQEHEVVFKATPPSKKRK